jgi:molybdate transport system substrate-binding protein
MGSTVITGISSMATRQVLAELAADYERASGVKLAIESVGGVDAAKRVAAGEAFDVVMLAADAIDKLIAGSHVAPGRVDLVRSPVAIAVKAGASQPDITSEEAVKQAVLAAHSLSYSTGPSGTHLVKLFERWGITAQIQDKLVQAPPGVPVGTLVARGEVELGFQQLSELMHLDGITVLGLLPPAIEFITTFSAGLGVHGQQPEAVRALLTWLTSPAAAAAKRRHGMEPA